MHVKAHLIHAVIEDRLCLCLTVKVGAVIGVVAANVKRWRRGGWNRQYRSLVIVAIKKPDSIATRLAGEPTTAFSFQRPRQDSNLCTWLRRPVLYPLSYEGGLLLLYTTVTM